MSAARLITRPLARLGGAVLGALAAIGRVTLFALSAARHCVTPPFYRNEILHALMNVGYLSLPVVGLTSVFTGAALALQIYAGGARFSVEQLVPQIVALGIVRELGPVMVGLMMAARVTSSVAAEIATMKVTEQIDALVTLSTHPMKYLTAPRMLAGLVTVPLLVAVGDIIGIFGGWFLAVKTLDFNSATYLKNTADFLQMNDIVSSLTKGAVFGVIATLMGCYFGMNSGRGAQGVGQATKTSVVAAAVLILAANVLLTQAFFTS
nr:ABC transporter permease [uncultured Celeribacter sp.]